MEHDRTVVDQLANNFIKGLEAVANREEAVLYIGSDDAVETTNKVLDFLGGYENLTRIVRARSGTIR